MKKPKVLLFALDGASPDLLSQWITEGKLLIFKKLIDSGRFCSLPSTYPPSTYAAWSTILTGYNPDEHNLFDFTVRKNYKINFTGGWDRKKSTIFKILSSLGINTISVGFPANYPVETNGNLIQVSGWDTPLSIRVKKDAVTPKKLYDEIIESLSSEVLEFHSQQDDEFNFNIYNYRNFTNALVKRIERKGKLAQWLMKEKKWDFTAIYWGEIDTACHYLWPLHDIQSPRKPPDLYPDFDPILKVYKSIESQLDEIINIYSPDVVIIVSDHGSGGASNKNIYINRFLEQNGLLKFKKRNINLFNKEIRNFIGKLTPQKIRSFIFEFGNNFFSQYLESQIRFGKIDWNNTYIFSEELNYFPSLWLNLIGRESRGKISVFDKDKFIDEVILLLNELKDPQNGQKIIDKVYRREDIWPGKYGKFAPDLYLELSLDNNYSYNLVPSFSSGNYFEVVSPENLTKNGKGKTLGGSHRKNGIFIITPGLTNDLNEINMPLITPLICNLYNLKKKEDNKVYIDNKKSIISERLRNLGYID